MFLIWKMLLSQMLKIFLTYFIFIWNYPGKKVLSLDEFKGNSGGQKYNGIVVDAKQHKGIDILPNRFENELIKYFSQFPSKTNVKYFVTDMNPHFREVSKVCFPNAIIVADRYHVIRQAYWAMERVRKNEQNKLSKQFRKYFKKSRCLLIRKPRLLYTPKAFHTEKLFILHCQSSCRTRKNAGRGTPWRNSAAYSQPSPGIRSSQGLLPGNCRAG